MEPKAIVGKAAWDQETNFHALTEALESIALDYFHWLGEVFPWLAWKIDLAR